MKIVADNTVPFLKGIAEPIAEVKYLTSKEFTPENVQDADILIVRSIDKCTRELLEGSRVKLITSATIGFDHIDTRYCDKAGITWKNSPGCNAVSVAQYVLSGLVLNRKLCPGFMPQNGMRFPLAGRLESASQFERLFRDAVPLKDSTGNRVPL